jgi:hypothetical protein
MAKPVVRNVAYGHTIGTGRTRRFFPHRASGDYDPTYLAGAEGVRARAAEKKRATKKGAKKKAKAKGKKVKRNPGSKMLGAYKFFDLAEKYAAHYRSQGRDVRVKEVPRSNRPYQVWEDLARVASKRRNPTVPVGKFLPARLNPDGTVSFLIEKTKRAVKRTVKKAKKRVKRATAKKRTTRRR